MADSNLDIWRLQAQADTQGLIEALQHSDPEIRRRAATALRALGATSSIPALQASLVDERDTDIRATILSVLDYLFEQEMDEDGDEATDEGQGHQVVYWIAQLTSDKADQIIRAAQYLAEAKEKIAVETLILVFRNSDLPAHARLAAAEALIKLESAPVEVTLLAALRHPDWRTRRNAAAVLAQISAEWAVEPLAAALHDDNEMVRKTAFAALKHLGTPEALEALEPPPITNAPVAQPPPLEPQMLADLDTPVATAKPVVEAAPPPGPSEHKPPASPEPPVTTAPSLQTVQQPLVIPEDKSKASSSAPSVEPQVSSAQQLAPATEQKALNSVESSAPVSPQPPSASPVEPAPSVPPVPAASADEPKPPTPQPSVTPPVVTPASTIVPAVSPSAPMEPPVVTKPAEETKMAASMPAIPVASPSTSVQLPQEPEASLQLQSGVVAVTSTEPTSTTASTTVVVTEPSVASPVIVSEPHDEEDTRPLSPVVEDNLTD